MVAAIHTCKLDVQLCMAVRDVVNIHVSVACTLLPLGHSTLQQRHWHVLCSRTDRTCLHEALTIDGQGMRVLLCLCPILLQALLQRGAVPAESSLFQKPQQHRDAGPGQPRCPSLLSLKRGHLLPPARQQKVHSDSALNGTQRRQPRGVARQPHDCAPKGSTRDEQGIAEPRVRIHVYMSGWSSSQQHVLMHKPATAGGQPG